MGNVIERLLLAYARLPDHPGKGRLINRGIALAGGAQHFQGEVMATRQGLRWALDLDCYVQRTLYTYGAIDANEVRSLLRFVGPASVFFDIGAYFGYYSLMAARQTRASATVYAFEPRPLNYKRLQRNLELNRRAGVRAFNIALADSEGEALFAEPQQINQGAGHLLRGQASDPSSARVQVTTLDRFVNANRISRLDAMKIDVEGAELAVIRGGLETLRRFKPVICIEFNPGTLLRADEQPAMLLATLTDLGYSLHRIGRRGATTPVTANLVMADPALVGGYTNLLCLPNRGDHRNSSRIPPAKP
jgi:FkbM family methyltransferase